MSIGSLFHARGPATVNALSPKLVHILRTRRSLFVADRRLCPISAADVEQQRSARYRGANVLINRSIGFSIGLSVWYLTGMISWQHTRKTTQNDEQILSDCFGCSCENRLKVVICGEDDESDPERSVDIIKRRRTKRLETNPRETVATAGLPTATRRKTAERRPRHMDNVIQTGTSTSPLTKNSMVNQ